MENLNTKRKSSFGAVRGALLDISNRNGNRDGDTSNRSRFEFSDSECLDSGIVSRGHTPVGGCRHESEVPNDLSSVSESEQFLELTLQSETLFLTDKARSSILSFNQEFESTMMPNSKSSVSFAELPELGFTSATVYCHDCAKDVYTIVDFSAKSVHEKVFKYFFNLFPFCDIPDWVKKNIVHRCSSCLILVGKGTV